MTYMTPPKNKKLKRTADRLVLEKRFYFGHVRHITRGLNETFQFTCVLGCLTTNLTSVEAVLDAAVTRQFVCNQLREYGDLNITVLSVTNKRTVQFEVSPNDVTSVFTLKEFNSLAHVLPITITKIQILN